MLLEKTDAYITTIGDDHQIKLPGNMPIGAKVAVILVPPDTPDQASRQARFRATLNAIRAASQSESLPSISDDALDVLIKKARKP
jgi:hypothetical protein